MARSGNQRRKRYVITYLKDGRPATIDVRAYTEDGALRVAERHGYDAIAIRLYRRGERFEKPADGGWSLIESAFFDACAELGLECLVKLTKTGQKGPREGRHSGRALADGTPYHDITIKNYLTAESAGRALWHELRHARQCEDLARETGTVFGTDEFRAEWKRVYRDGTTYRSKQWEREARATEPNNDRLPLARRSYV